MQFIKCIASQPGLFENITIDMLSRITIVSGKNSSGKSLIAQSLIDGIWRKFSNFRLIQKEMWDTLFIDILFSLSSNDQYRIINNSNKYFTIRFSNGNEKLIYSEIIKEGDNINEGTIDILKTIEGKTLQNFFNNIDINTFINTSFLPPSSDIEKGKIIDYSVIKKLLIEDNTGFYRLHSILKKEIEKGNKANNKLLDEMLKYENLLKDLNKRIQIIDIKYFRIGKLNKEKDIIKEEIDKLINSRTQINKEKATIKKIIDSLVKIEDLNINLERLQEDVQHEKSKMKSISELKKELKRSFPKFRDLGIQNNTTLDKLESIFNEVKNLNEKINNFYFNKDLKKNRIKKIIFAVNIAAITAVLSILYKNSFSFNMENIYLFAGILGFALIFSPILLIVSAAKSKARELDNMVKEKRILEDKLKKMLEESQVELEGYNQSDFYEFLLQFFEDYIEFSERNNDLRGLKSTLKEKNHLQKIQKELESLKKEKEKIKQDINNTIESLNINKNIELENNKIYDLMLKYDREMETINEQIRNKDKILVRINEEISQNPYKDDEKDSLIEDRANLSSALKDLKANKNSMNFIIEVLSEAVNRREKKQLNKLIDTTLDMFDYITANQFSASIDGNTIMQVIKGNETVEDLNPALIHALSLSIKFSLTDFLIDADISLPLIIDDPFLYMDDDRISRFKELVFDISEKRQVIIFTHRRDKSDWGNYIEL